MVRECKDETGLLDEQEHGTTTTMVVVVGRGNSDG